MKTISFVTQKGGAGKSTLAISCAVAATQRGAKVLMLDVNPQKTAFEWWERREAETPVVGEVKSKDLASYLSRAAESGFDYVIVDTGGKNDPSIAIAIEQSDFCVVPCRPTIADISAVRETIETAKRFNKPIGFVLSQTQSRERKERLQQAEALNAFGALAPCRIVTRGDYQDSLGVGEGVTEYSPDGKAASEVNALWDWIEAKTNKISFSG